eukprot:118903-Pyramimonas_sp.AAC.1
MPANLFSEFSSVSRLLEMSQFAHRCRCSALPGRAALLTECSALRFRGTKILNSLGPGPQLPGAPIGSRSWRTGRGWSTWHC